MVVMVVTAATLRAMAVTAAMPRAMVATAAVVVADVAATVVVAAAVEPVDAAVVAATDAMAATAATVATAATAATVVVMRLPQPMPLRPPRPLMRPSRALSGRPLASVRSTSVAKTTSRPSNPSTVHEVMCLMRFGWESTANRDRRTPCPAVLFVALNRARRKLPGSIRSETFCVDRHDRSNAHARGPRPGRTPRRFLAAETDNREEVVPPIATASLGYWRQSDAADGSMPYDTHLR